MNTTQLLSLATPLAIICAFLSSLILLAFLFSLVRKGGVKSRMTMLGYHMAYFNNASYSERLSRNDGLRM